MAADLVIKNGWVVTPDATFKGGVAISGEKIVAIGADDSLPQGKEEIRNARSPSLAKKLANEKYRSARDPDWAAKKLIVVEEIVRVKLAQHPEAQEALRDSGDEDIVEDSPTDYFWGAGADGSGQNMFGKIWMKIREEVTRERRL